ncbi:cell division cycle 7-related protein kinase-like isoform X2 [Onthophagus taurus]|uniref:cell division cycle 7-related protein kinase-like isoform X2 n=1 Tax=Onthophagus taurus TaxID=166361 RepID=UPI000C200553|nr:cell division cycle 7-related protein kinase-like isoform X2 [Onthophagus taurus]
MAPTCTPDKKNDYENERLGSNELYFTTTDFNGLSANNSATELNNESLQMSKLHEQFPELGEHFNLIKKVGHGTFSTVYLATVKTNKDKQYAIKHVVPTCHPDRIRFELQCLKDIGGAENIVGVDLCFRNLNNVIFVMPFQQHDFFGDYVTEMDTEEIALYMKNLLKAIARVHSFNIVHRDIKPSNFLYDRKNRKYLLVDFGLAHTVTDPIKPIETIKKRKREDSPPTSNVSKKPNLSKLPKKGSSQKENDVNLKLKTVTRQLSFMNSSNSVQYVSNGAAAGSSVFSKSPPMKSSLETNQLNQCGCYGKARTCAKCLAKKNLRALRAGTPGFRPPEVLLKSLQQDTGIDIWATGIILLSILSGSCNFFASPDDVTALSEIITVFGFNAIKKVASQCGRHLICSEKCPPLDLRKICRILKMRDKLMNYLETEEMCLKCNQLEVFCICIGTTLCKKICDKYPDQAYDLLYKLLDVNPNTRISAVEALNHPFFSKV